MIDMMIIIWHYIIWLICTSQFLVKTERYTIRFYYLKVKNELCVFCGFFVSVNWWGLDNYHVWELWCHDSFGVVGKLLKKISDNLWNCVYILLYPDPLSKWVYMRKFTGWYEKRDILRVHLELYIYMCVCVCVCNYYAISTLNL